MKTTQATTMAATYLTWKEMYQLAYDPENMDLGAPGTNAALALRNMGLQADYHPLTREITFDPLEKAFFAMGDECSRVNGKLWNFTGNRRKRKYPLETMTIGAVGGFAATAAVLYTLLYAQSD